MLPPVPPGVPKEREQTENCPESREGQVCQRRAAGAVWCAPTASTRWHGGCTGWPRAKRSPHPEITTLQEMPWDSSSVLGVCSTPNTTASEISALRTQPRTVLPKRGEAVSSERQQLGACGAGSTGHAPSIREKSHPLACSPFLSFSLH